MFEFGGSLLCSIIMAIITDTDDYYNSPGVLPRIMRFLKHVLYNIFFMPQKYLAQCFALSTWPINIYWCRGGGGGAGGNGPLETSLLLFNLSQ